jgi:plasmid stabilization system protein ParE
LRSHPYLGSASQNHPGYYQLVIHGHRLIYRVIPDTGDGATAGDVLIVALFGPGQP